MFYARPSQARPSYAHHVVLVHAYTTPTHVSCMAKTCTPITSHRMFYIRIISNRPTVAVGSKTCLVNSLSHGPLCPTLCHGPADLPHKNRADLPEGHELRTAVIEALSLRVSWLNNYFLIWYFNNFLQAVVGPLQQVLTLYTLWRACNLTSFSPCLTGPVDYPFASRDEGPGFKSPGGYLCETGISPVCVLDTLVTPTWSNHWLRHP